MRYFMYSFINKKYMYVCQKKPFWAAFNSQNCKFQKIWKFVKFFQSKAQLANK